MNEPHDPAAWRRALRAVLYGRVSTDDPEEQDPESQFVVLRPFCASRGWPVVAEFSDRISSDPANKKRRRRDPPGLAKAIHLIEERHADVLVVMGADRLVAGPIALLNLVARIQDLGGQVTSYRDGRDLDTTTDHGELQTFLDGWFNRMRLRLGKVATKAGIKRYREANDGRWGRPPSAPTAAQVAEARLRRSPPLSLRAVARELGCSHTHAQARWAEWQKNPGAIPASEPVADLDQK